MVRPTLRDWLSEAPFTLGLSAGFFGFFAHAGLVAALEDEGLKPEQLAGSSAGALVAGLWASGVDSARIAGRFLDLRREEFWDPAPGFGLLKGRRFAALLDEYLDVETFERCRAPLSISVFDVRGLRTVTLRKGRLAPAIQASCTFPGLFHPVWMNGRPYIDGGVADRSGLRGVPAGERVLYHHLSSRSKIRGRLPGLTGCPRREAMVPVIVDGLPRLGPYRLERGADAFEAARSAMRDALDRRVSAGGAPVLVG